MKNASNAINVLPSSLLTSMTKHRFIVKLAMLSFADASQFRLSETILYRINSSCKLFISMYTFIIFTIDLSALGNGFVRE